MKKNLIIISFIIGFILLIPFNVNSMSISALQELCKPLVALDNEGKTYYCTSQHKNITISQSRPTDPIANMDEPSDEGNLDSYMDSNSCTNTGDCFKGVGLMFRLLYYNGSGEPVAVGKRYHVYNPSLLTDQTIANKVALPNSPGDLRDPNKNFPLTQVMAPKNQVLTAHDNWFEMREVGSLVHQDGAEYTDSSGKYHEAQPPNKYLGQNDFLLEWETNKGIETKKVKDYYSYQYDGSEGEVVQRYSFLTQPTDEYMGHHTGYKKFIFSYNTPYTRTSYPKEKILSPDWREGQPLVALDFSDWEVDSSLKESEVESNFLNDKMKKYFARGTVAETVKAVNSKFGTHISERDLEYYYIEVQAIYRIYTDKKEKVGTFVVKDIEEITEEETVIDSSFYVDSTQTSANDSDLCVNRGKHWAQVGEGKAAKAAVAPSCSRISTAPQGTVCTLSSDKKSCLPSGYCSHNSGSAAEAAVPPNAQCTDSCSATSCAAVYVNYWSRKYAPYGKKNIHRMLGTAYVGWSQLVYTMSGSNESCETDKITTSLGDVMSQNKHCDLAEFSSDYSVQEQANQCASTNSYKYYVGPDPDRALVGTSSSNPFNLFGSNGNKCRSGVKHYYLFDLEAECDPDTDTCIPKCQQVCLNAGAHNTNSYLQCAENFCDHDVDYSLGGQPFVRKKECLLSSSYCDYQYGRVPTMGANSGKERQAVSSCANTKLFKTGSGTSFTLEKTPYNSSSACGINANGFITGSVGKDSVCIGDVVTDYNGTDAGDKGFDERTYINIACQETDSITSVGGLNTPVRAGLPISYSLNTKGQVTCVAFFNYEQWKVDYAIVPSADIIRRKRLDYIYNKFNNLMTNDYTVSNSLRNFDAFDLDGKTMQHWTITDADGLGQVKWDNYIIDINKSSAYAESKETLKNGTTKKQEENPLTDFTESKATLSVVPSEMDLTNGVYKTYNTGGLYESGVLSSDKKLIKVANDSITTPGTGSNGNSILVGYVQTTTDTKSYVYAKYCVNKEGKVTKADDTGVCDDGKLGNYLFYTDFSDIDNNGNADIHNIKGTVTVQSSLPSSNATVYNNADTCPINIIGIPTRNTAYCKIKIINGDSYGDKTFINGSDVEVAIEFFDDKDIKITPDSFTFNMESPYRNETISEKYKKLSLVSEAYKSGLEDIHLTGNFTYSGHQTTPCDEYLTIIQEGDLCKIEKQGAGTHVYNVNTNVASPKAVMGGMLNQRITQRILQDLYTADHLPSNLGRLGRPKYEDGLYKYLLDLTKSDFDSESTVIGYVNNGTKGEFCPKPEGTPKQCVKNTKTGKGLYLPGQYAEITEYCKDNWAKDTYGFDSYATCVDTCARCPTHENEVIGWEDNAQATQDNIKKVNDFCDAYATYGYTSKDACVSLVYERCINPGEYKYRPVNTSNPFPSAVDNASIAPGYNVGDRIIGSNWKGKEHYITEGNPDRPRYQIALTADRIKQIRNELSGDNKTSVYTQLHPVNDSVESNNYMSKYIRTDYYDMFCFIQGERTTSTTGGCEISNN